MNLLDKYVSKAEKTASRIIDGQAVIVTLGTINEDRQIITLSSTGTQVWKFLEGRIKVKDVIGKVTKELNVEYNEYRDEILNYIEKLIKQKLIEIFDTKK